MLYPAREGPLAHERARVVRFPECTDGSFSSASEAMLFPALTLVLSRTDDRVKGAFFPKKQEGLNIMAIKSSPP
jgi:hypothetical protein